MGTGYVRNDTPNNIADGNVINASDLDGEFDAIQAAFNATTGHSHDGTTGEGPQIDTAGIANDAVTLGTKTSGNYVAAGAVSGVGLSGSASSEGATFTVTSNATSANTASTIVARDASGNFSAGTITASLTGTASNAALLDSLDSTQFLRSDAADTKTSGDLSFSDNVKAVFGAGSDLQIYHDGSNSYIDDAGTGGLILQGNGGITLGKYTGETMAEFEADGACKLRYDNANKLATTATGADITGTLTADGLTVDTDTLHVDSTNNRVGIGTTGPANNLHIYATSYPAIRLDDGTAYSSIYNDSTDGSLVYSADDGNARANSKQIFYVDGSEKMRITSGGFVGIGGSNPEALLHVEGASTGQMMFRTSGSSVNKWLIGKNSSSDFSIGEDGNEWLYVERDSGNVGIGTASPDTNLDVERSSNDTGGIKVQNTNNAQASAVAQVEISGGDNAYANLLLECSGTNHSIRQDGSGNLKFINASSERARFTSSGAFILGKTVDSIHNTGISAAGSATGGGHLTATNSGNPPFALNRLASDGSIADFYRQGSVVGSISVTTSGTTYNTTSDLRLKENIEPLEATDKLMAMNPVSYNWKADPDGPRSMGFIAQEMQEVMPEAVSTGDDEDAMMSMDYGRITPILVSALQDAHRKIEQLEQRIADMEAK